MSYASSGPARRLPSNLTIEGRIITLSSVLDLQSQPLAGLYVSSRSLEYIGTWKQASIKFAS